MLEPNESNTGGFAAVDGTYKKQQNIDRFFDTNFKQEVAEIKVLKDRHRNSLENLVDDFVQIPTEQSFEDLSATQRHRRQGAFSRHGSEFWGIQDCSMIQSEF